MRLDGPAIARKLVAGHDRASWPRHGHEDQSDRLFQRSAAGTRDAGHPDRNVRRESRPRPFGHLARDGFDGLALRGLQVILTGTADERPIAAAVLASIPSIGPTGLGAQPRWRTAFHPFTWGAGIEAMHENRR